MSARITHFASRASALEIQRLNTRLTPNGWEHPAWTEVFLNSALSDEALQALEEAQEFKRLERCIHEATS